MEFETIKNSIREYWWVAAALVGVFSYCYFDFFDPYFETRQIICKVVKLRGRNDIEVEYVRDGTRKHLTSRHDGILRKYLHPGERFYLSYRLHGIEAVTINFEKPAISDTTLYAETVTGSCEIVGGFRVKFVKYTYRVHDKLYERVQKVKNFTLEEGKNFRVKFLKDDPEQSYVCLDSANCWQLINEDDFEKLPSPEDMGFQ